MEATVSLAVTSHALEEKTNVKIQILGGTMHWPKIHVELQMEDPWLGGLGYVATFSGVTSYMSGIFIFLDL